MMFALQGFDFGQFMLENWEAIVAVVLMLASAIVALTANPWDNMVVNALKALFESIRGSLGKGSGEADAPAEPTLLPGADDDGGSAAPEAHDEDEGGPRPLR